MPSKSIWLALVASVLPGWAVAAPGPGATAQFLAASSAQTGLRAMPGGGLDLQDAYDGTQLLATSSVFHPLFLAYAPSSTHGGNSGKANDMASSTPGAAANAAIPNAVQGAAFTPSIIEPSLARQTADLPLSVQAPAVVAQPPSAEPSVGRAADAAQPAASAKLSDSRVPAAAPASAAPPLPAAGLSFLGPDTATPAIPTPEPTMLALFGLGLAGIAVARRR